MFIGAYWSQRRESKEQAAARIARFLTAISSKNESLSRWFIKGRTKAQARTEFSLDPGSVERALASGQRDVGCDPMPEVGFTLSIWNGDEISLAATIGAFSPYIQNSLVLTFGRKTDRLSESDWRDLLSAAVLAFDPEHGVVTSSECLARTKARNAWDVGWLTYERGRGIQEHTVP